MMRATGKPSSRAVGTARRATGLLALAGVPLSAHGAGQYEVEDAGLISPYSVTSEIWHSDKDEATHLNFTGRHAGPWQATIEAASERAAPREAYAFEGRWVPLQLDRDGYGLGVFGGAEYDSADEEVAEYQARAIGTIEPLPGRAVVHGNLGAVHDDDESETDPFWGVATEAVIHGPIEGVAEVFGVDDDDPTWQVGLRASIFDGQATVDASWIEDEEVGDDGWAFGVGIEPIRF